MSEYDRARDQAIQDVDTMLQAAGLKRDDMVVTDVVVVVTQRGFNGDGGTSLTCTLIPSDTPMPMVLGMLNMSVIEHAQHTARLYRMFNHLEEDDG